MGPVGMARNRGVPVLGRAKTSSASSPATQTPLRSGGRLLTRCKQPLHLALGGGEKKVQQLLGGRLESQEWEWMQACAMPSQKSKRIVLNSLESSLVGLPPVYLVNALARGKAVLKARAKVRVRFKDKDRARCKVRVEKEQMPAGVVKETPNSRSKAGNGNVRTATTQAGRTLGT